MRAIGGKSRSDDIIGSIQSFQFVQRPGIPELDLASGRSAGFACSTRPFRPHSRHRDHRPITVDFPPLQARDVRRVRFGQ
jgi:hypothetical protein